MTTPSCISLDQKVKINLIVAYVSIQNNTFIVSGDAETKTIKDLLPDIIQQLGPKQHKLLQELVTSSMTTGASEEVPNLVDAKEDLNKVE
jgi:predicted lipid-binding transport protein (Tim44 family)